MQVIERNPYRLAGLLVGATAAEQRRQTSRLIKFLEAEQEPEDDFSFPILGQLNRDVEMVNSAVSALNLDKDKMDAALFWFYNGNSITDEPAFEALKIGDVTTAINIWTKLTATPTVTKKNASAYSNLSTLCFTGVLDGTSTKAVLIKQALWLKLRFLESDNALDLKALATDETFVITKKALQLSYLGWLQAEFKKEGQESSSAFLQALLELEFDAKGDFLKSYVEGPIGQVDRFIEESKSNRHNHKEKIVASTNKLNSNTKPLMETLKSILGVSDFKYSTIADKLAMEFFSNGRDYFMHKKDSPSDPGDFSLKCFKVAKKYAVGTIARQQIDENIKDLEEWIADKPRRTRQNEILGELEFVKSRLDRFQSLIDSTENAKDLVVSCKPKLAAIKIALGPHDDFYLMLSGAVANNALGMLIEVVNTAQKSPLVQYGELSGLRSVVRNALEVSVMIDSLDMPSNHRENFRRNHSALKSISAQIGIPSSTPSTQSSSRNTVVTTPSSTTSNNGWWIGGLIGLIIGVSAEFGIGSFFIGFIGACEVVRFFGQRFGFG